MVNPSDCEVCFCEVQGDVMAARVVRDPAGGVESLPDGAVQEGTRYASSSMTSRAGARRAAVNCRAGARAASCRAGAAQNLKKILTKASLAFG